MDIFNEEENFEVTTGIEESLERVDVGKEGTIDPQCGKRKEKQQHRFGPCLKFSPRLETEKKRGANVNSVVLYVCVTVVMALVT